MTRRDRTADRARRPGSAGSRTSHQPRRLTPPRIGRTPGHSNFLPRINESLPGSSSRLRPSMSPCRWRHGLIACTEARVSVAVRGCSRRTVKSLALSTPRSHARGGLREIEGRLEMQLPRLGSVTCRVGIAPVQARPAATNIVSSDGVTRGCGADCLRQPSFTEPSDGTPAFHLIPIELCRITQPTCRG